MTMINKEKLFNNYLERQRSVGIYIHIPFCEKRCYYCDFLSSTDYSKEDQYVNHLLKEIDLYKENYGSLNIDTIYFGGGTPSSLNRGQIAKIMDLLAKNNSIARCGEFTIELNPESVEKDKLREYRGSGLNRVSMGCQSFNDQMLKKIGRLHNEKKIYESYDLIRQAGFDNVNLDLIFALPGQRSEDFARDLEKLLSLNPDQISAYSLILEEDTPLYEMSQQGALDLASDTRDRSYYHWLIRELEEEGYKRYEISNFAKDEKKSAHNLKYWNSDYYIGLGLGSSSFFDGARYKNHYSFEKYFDAVNKGLLPIIEREKMNYDRLKTDYILMKMRLREGIDRKAYKEYFAIDFYEEFKDTINFFAKDGFIELTRNNVYFTVRGVDISNQFFLEII